MNRASGCSLVLLAALAPSADAQDYRARLDLEAQAAAFRGVMVDSIPVSQTVLGASGGPETSDGFAVRCPGFNAYCYFFRPGPVQHGGPIAATANFALWGLGIRGLSLHGIARAGTDVGGTDTWPGTRPSLQLFEGYAEYASGVVTAQAGRVQSFSRLGAVGYDGGTITVRSSALGLEGKVYGGLGLAHAAAIPINSPVLNPLDEYQPAERQWLVGGAVALTVPFATARLLYQREVDRRSSYFISERSGIAVTILPGIEGLSLAGGADYDLASASWGSAEGSISFGRGPLWGSLEGRRYRPHFDLWTIWGAFSPIPYRAASATLRLQPGSGLSIVARGEAYRYDASGAETPLVDVREDGWRLFLGADYSPRDNLDFSAGYRPEVGPGAAATSYEASGTYRSGNRGALTLQGALLERPLEFRYDDASVWMIGLRAAARSSSRISFSAGASHYMETRDRPDAAAFDWNQTRFDLRITVLFGSDTDLTRLPPAIPRIRP